MTALGRFSLGLALLGAVALACSSKDSPPPPAADDSAGGPTGGGKLETGGDGSTPSEGGADSLGNGGAAGETSLIGTIGGDFPVGISGGAPSDAPAACDPAAKWGKPVPLAKLSTKQADERLLAMSHDELSLIFSRGSELLVADRSDAQGDFAAPVTITLPSEYTFESGLALSSDGLTLVAIRKDLSAFADVTRGSRGQTFDAAPNTSRFSWVNLTLGQSGQLSWPVLSADDKTFVFTRLEGSDMTAFRIRGDHFDKAEVLDPVTLGAVDGKHKLTQSLSADERTLFFFDEAVGHVAALGSMNTRAAYIERFELPGLLSAFSNVGCGRLYGTLEVDGSLDLVVETPN